MTLIAASKVVVFPDTAALRKPGLQRIAEAVRFRFGAATPAVLVAGEEHRAAAHAVGLEIAEPAAAMRAPGADVWLLALSFLPVFHGEGGFERVQLPGDAGLREGKRLFVMEPDGFVHPLQVKTDGILDSPCTTEYDAHLERNVFSRMGTRNFRGAAYFFPYNGFYVGHPSAFGPIDEFGFRNAADHGALKERPRDHLLVAVFGGSTVWSPCCLQPETFCAVLENMLCGELAAKGDPRTASVINFGISGHTVLNELFSYLLFCHRLKPEIVIAHDLFNDLANSLQTDPDLLNRHDMTYMAAMEQWAQQLMGAHQVPLTQSSDPGKPIRITNGPQSIVRAYMARKRQFADIVEQAGAAFIWGTQPAWFAKSAAPAEAERFRKIRALSPQLDPMYRALPQLYDLVRTTILDSNIAHAVDVHCAFTQLTAEDEVFADHAHLNPKGDAIIAKIYAEDIMARIMPALTERR